MQLAVPAPVLAVAEASQDDGAVDEGTLLHFQFKVTNQGGADLEIKDVKASCGCTVPHWDKLIPKVDGGGAGGCPLLMIGIRKTCFDRAL